MLNKILGNASVENTSDLLEPYISEGERILFSFKFVRDELTLTNKGIYFIDVQGMTGKKKSIQFYPAKNVDGIEFESAGTFDLDTDLKIIIRGKQEPISIKVMKKHEEVTQTIIKIIKEEYFD